jgi:hypothetical protein
VDEALPPPISNTCPTVCQLVCLITCLVAGLLACLAARLPARLSAYLLISPPTCLIHRDKPRVRMPAKNVSTFEINIFYHFCLWAPLLFLTQSKETVSWMFFYNKSQILSILFLVKYEKNNTLISF